MIRACVRVRLHVLVCSEQRYKSWKMVYMYIGVLGRIDIFEFKLCVCSVL